MELDDLRKNEEKETVYLFKYFQGKLNILLAISMTTFVRYYLLNIKTFDIRDRV